MELYYWITLIPDLSPGRTHPWTAFAQTPSHSYKNAGTTSTPETHKNDPFAYLLYVGFFFLFRAV